MSKTESTIKKIKGWLERFSNPVVMCSFGKDSMVLLHLTRLVGWRLPIIFHSHPWMPEKNKFAYQQIVGMGLMTYDWPPSLCGIKCKSDHFEPAFAYQIGPRSHSIMPVDVIEPDGKSKWICGKNDILQRPTGTFNYPWDLCFIGHKSCDTDPFLGPIELTSDETKTEDGPVVAFPLKDWTDGDIWDYTERNNVPVQETRYQDRREIDDKSMNPDYVMACTKCIDPRQPSKVMCPLINKEIDNVAHLFPRLEQKYSYIAQHA